MRNPTVKEFHKSAKKYHWSLSGKVINKKCYWSLFDSYCRRLRLRML